MKLLDVLCAGVRGAENGSVDIFARGTSTRAQVYTDYDGSGSQTPSASLPLDANGGAVWYVNQPVLCRAYSSTGAIVRQFTAFETATDVEVRSTSFTGVDYTTGASAANNPTLLSTVLDGVKTSFGSTDWNVLVSGAAKTMQTALGAVTGVFFNVKDPTYGALGDGATDDRAAFQAAITAANAVGGYVVVPPSASGYKIGAPGLTVNGCAGILCAPNTQISSSGSASVLLTIVGGSNGKFRLTGYWNAVTAGWITISCPTAIDVICDSAVLINTGASGVFVSNVAVRLFLIGCTLQGNSLNWLSIVNGALLAAGCRFTHTTNTAIASIVVGGGFIMGSTFDCTAAGGPMTYYIAPVASSSGTLLLAGNSFPNPTAVGSVAQAFGNAVPNGIVDMGNFYGTAMAATNSAVPADATARHGQAFALERGEQYVASDAATVTLDVTYGSWRIRRSTAGGQTVNIPIPSYAGQIASLTFINGTGGTETLGTIKGLASVAPTGPNNQTIMMRAVAVSTTLSWVLISSQAWS